ncbi:MAG TPA: hypothetical protein VGM94_03530 [Galbitalea sp.]|jgi:hypothetical protein
MSDGRLFDDVRDLERKVRTNSAETEWAAGASMKRSAEDELREAIYQILLSRGPLTDEEIARYYYQAGGKLTPQRIRTARAALTHVTPSSLPIVQSAGRNGISATGRSMQKWRAIL